MNYENPETEIDMVDLFARLLKDWRRCLLCAVILAIFLCGYGVFKEYRARQMEKEKYTAEKLQNAKGILKDEDALEAERVYNQYRTLSEYAELQQKNADHSLVLTLMPESATVLRRQYRVYSEQADAVTILKQLVMNRDLYEKIAAYVGDPEYVDYAGELFSISDYTAGDPQGYLLGQDGTPITSRYQTVMGVDVYGPDAEFCSAILSIVDEALNRKIGQVSTDKIETTIEKISEYTLTNAAAYINSRQQGITTAAVNTAAAVTKFKTDTVEKLSDEQRAYFAQLEKKPLDSDTAIKANRRYRSIIKKNVLIGGFAGLFVYILIGVVFPYVLRGVIRTGDEVEHSFRIRHMQTIRLFVAQDGKKGKGDPIKRLGDRLIARGEREGLSQADAVEMAAQETVTRLNKGVAKETDGVGTADAAVARSNVFVLADEETDKALGLADAIRKKLDGAGTVSQGIPDSATDTFASLLSADAALLVITVDKTKRNRVYEWCRLCRDNKIPIIGYIAVRGA